ncbi:MAG: 3-deoxy-D-manno-octulosonic acid transferase [Acidobacteriota bacterium]
MFFLYSILFTLGFIVLLPRFIFDAVSKGKYADGFWQRLGFLPKFDANGKRVIWLHCVSVGETNAARPLAQKLKEYYPGSCLIISTTTRTGQELARTAFTDIADVVFYFPFDWKWTVRRALRRFSPSAVLLMEAEIWFNFIRETNKQGIHLAIVNGRLSERSFTRFCKIKRFISRVLEYLDLALMQEEVDAERMLSLGIAPEKVKITGNLKFDHDLDEQETALTAVFRERFEITPDAPLIIAASTHSREEGWILAAFKEIWKSSTNSLPRLMIVPRHPERFPEVGELLKKTGFTWVRRSEAESNRDKMAEIILLDSIGELRAAYPLAEIVFVGGSLIPHGGQSIYEPASAGKAIVTGPFTSNFDAAVTEFLNRDALVQMSRVAEEDIVTKLEITLSELLNNVERRRLLGSNALEVMNNNRGAVAKTLEYLRPLLGPPENQ